MTTQQQNAHGVPPLSAEEALSAWWDGECMPQPASCVDRFLAIATESARQSLRSYTLIGAALRHEPLDARDISLLVSARLARDETDADQAAHAAQTPQVLNFPQTRVRRSIAAWRGSIAASFVAGMVGIGVWIMPPAGTGALSLQSDPGMNVLHTASSPQSANLLPVSARDVSGRPLPNWAHTSVRKGPMNPYLVTHFESVSPDLSEVMPTLRMINFQSE